MPINGEVSEGDANRILEVVGEDYFPPNFNEYMLKEQLKWWRHTRVYIQRSYFGWVFWREQDRQIEPSLPRDNRANFNPDVCAIPKVESNIRRALEKLISHLSFSVVNSSLIQFWAPATLEGRTQLRTQYQPFALGPTMDTTDRDCLCDYRLKMCSSEYNNCFYVDAESGEEQLGLPGRVFLHQFPESSPHVQCYSTKEYPQRDLALRRHIWGSWAVPVFEHSSQTCVGVLEMVAHNSIASVWRHESFLRDMHDIFQEFGLQCFDGYKICKMPSRENVKTNSSVFQELETVMRLVCETHQLPLAMASVPCSACNGLRSMGVRYSASFDYNLFNFLKVIECSHLRKGWIAEKALSPPNMFYFKDISKLSVDEYPLVPYARMCKFSGWFIICLRSRNTGDDICVLEFFWPTSSSEDNENIQTRLSKLLGMMEHKLGNFQFASGLNLGYLSSVEVIDVQNDQKIHNVYKIQATRTFSNSQDSDPFTEQSSASVSNLGLWR